MGYEQHETVAQQSKANFSPILCAQTLRRNLTMILAWFIFFHACAVIVHSQYDELPPCGTENVSITSYVRPNPCVDVDTLDQCAYRMIELGCGCVDQYSLEHCCRLCMF